MVTSNTTRTGRCPHTPSAPPIWRLSPRDEAEQDYTERNLTGARCMWVPYAGLPAVSLNVPLAMSAPAKDAPAAEAPAGDAAAAGPMAGAFDFSAMQNLLNDPSIRVMAEQIAEDPAFAQLTKTLQQTMGGAEGGAGACSLYTHEPPGASALAPSPHLSDQWPKNN